MTTFPEIAASYRRLLFEQFGSGEIDDDDAKMPDIPRYNSTVYREFKQECLTFLVSNQSVSAHKPNTVCVGNFPAYCRRNMLESICVACQLYRVWPWLSRQSRWPYCHQAFTTRCRWCSSAMKKAPSKAKKSM